MLRRLHVPSHPDLLVGADAVDDAAVWRRPDGRALIATVDFFTPIVDDARTWGRIAAANAASDVYAMGGSPLFALNIVAWPKDRLDLDLLGDVLDGANEVAAAGGWLVVGGHTVDGPEPLFGQAVIGEADPARLLTNAGAAPGQVLVLTKALGTGVVATAHKRAEPAAIAAGGDLAAAYGAAVRSMTVLNAEASLAALAAGATAATDVTGFGLLGHLHRMAAASGLEATVDVTAVPLLPGVADLVAAGNVPGGTGRNLELVEGLLAWLDGVDPAVWAPVLADPQTSGGLLVSVPPSSAEALVEGLRAAGHAAAVVGTLGAGTPGRIAVGAG